MQWGYKVWGEQSLERACLTHVFHKDTQMGAYIIKQTEWEKNKIKNCKKTVERIRIVVAKKLRMIAVKSLAIVNKMNNSLPLYSV